MASYANHAAPLEATSTLQGIFGALFEGIGNSSYKTSITKSIVLRSGFSQELRLVACLVELFMTNTEERLCSGRLEFMG